MTADAEMLGRVEVLFNRARGSVHFDVTDDSGELRALIEEAESTDPTHDRTRWKEACAELATFLSGVEAELTHAAAVDSASAVTRMGWGGETWTILASDARRTARAAHAATVREEASRRLAHVQLFTTTAAVAARIAALMSTSGGAVLALPVAWRLVRTLTEQARSRN